VSDGTALLISWLRFGDRDLDARYTPRALEALARLEADQVELSRPSMPGDVLDVLHMVASTVQVELPEEIGLTAYVHLLQPLPLHVLKAAALEILRRHAFRTMPLPAEFLKADAAREWEYASAWLQQSIVRWRKKLQQNSK